MTEHTVLIDFDPGSEVSYHAHLAHRVQEGQTRAIERQTREIVDSRTALAKGFTGLGEQILRGLAPIQATNSALAQITRSHEQLADAVLQGQREIARAQRQTAEVIAWGFAGLSRDVLDLKSELGAKLDSLIELKKKGNQWIEAYSKFETAKNNYRRGLYKEARDRVMEAINGTSFHEGYPEEYWFHFLLGNIQLGSWAGERPNIDNEVVDAAQAEHAFITASRYAESKADRSEAFLSAGRAAFVQRELDRAIERSKQGLDGSTRLADVHWQLARCYAGLRDSEGREEAGHHLRTALALNQDYLLAAWDEEAYFNRVGALEIALLPASRQFREGVRNEIDNYRLAGCYATFPNGRTEAIHHLRAAVDKKLDVFLWVEGPRLNRQGVLEEVRRGKVAEFRARLNTELDHLERTFQLILTGEYRETSSSAAFDGLRALSGAIATAREEASKADVFDLDAAIVALAGKRSDLEVLRRELRHFSNVLQFVSTAEHGGYPARRLLESEAVTLREALATARVKATQRGVFDLNPAIETLGSERATLDGLKSVYLKRLEEALRDKWKGTGPARRAEGAENARQRRSDELKNARPAIDALPAAAWWWAFGLVVIGPIGWIIGGAIVSWGALRGIAWLFFWLDRGWKRGALNEAQTIAAGRRAEAEKAWQAELEIVQAARDTVWP